VGPNKIFQFLWIEGVITLALLVNQVEVETEYPNGFGCWKTRQLFEAIGMHIRL